MSEYQYYEFQTVDRPLSDRDMEELRALSTRAEITRTSFSNEYSYGNFRGDENKVLEKYFDAFVYVANWGTHRVMFRLPRGLVDDETLKLYSTGETLALRATKEHVILDFTSQTEDHEWEQGEGWLDSLLPVRAELLAGDLRALYLGWLCGLCSEYRDEDEFSEDAREPPVPPGLGKLSPALRHLAEFLRIDEDLIDAASAGSEGGAPAGPAQEELAAWVAGLAAAEKDALLLRVLNDEAPHVRADLLRRFRKELARKAGKKEVPAEADRRTVGQLLAARDELERQRRERKARRDAAERARQEQEKAAARARHLDELATRESRAWSEVEPLIQSKVPKNYDRAVELLRDLRDVAERAGRRAEALKRIDELRGRHAGKPSFQERLRKAGL